MTDLDQAIRTIARHIIHHEISGVIDPDWGNYPHIGTHDWEAVIGEVQALTTPPEPGEYHAAYSLLSARANLITPTVHTSSTAPNSQSAPTGGS